MSSDLGNLLERLHGARNSYRTLRATIRMVRDEKLEREARQRRQEASSGARSVWVATWGSRQSSGDPTTEGRWERVSRLWVRSPSQLRWECEFEWRGERGKSTSLIDGERYWSDDSVRGFTTSERRSFSLQIPDLDLLDPWQLASDFDFEVRGKGVHAGREAIEARATTRKPRVGYRRPISLFSPKGEGYDIAVDLERGTVLRAAALVDGEPFETAEVTEIAFDEEFDAAVFQVEPPPEDERWSPHPSQPSSCGFCGKSEDEVKHMVQGKPVLICDECSQISRDVSESNAAQRFLSR